MKFRAGQLVKHHGTGDIGIVKQYAPSPYTGEKWLVLWFTDYNDTGSPSTTKHREDQLHLLEFNNEV
jgi:hypothetical protein